MIEGITTTDTKKIQFEFVAAVPMEKVSRARDREKEICESVVVEGGKRFTRERLSLVV